MNNISNYYLKTFLRCIKNSWEGQHQTDEYFYKKYADILLNLILNCKIQTIKQDNTDKIKAFIIYLNNILHFVYVNKENREKGLATELLKPVIINNEIICTFKTKDFVNYCYKKNIKINYQPLERYQEFNS